MFPNVEANPVRSVCACVVVPCSWHVQDLRPNKPTPKKRGEEAIKSMCKVTFLSMKIVIL